LNASATKRIHDLKKFYALDLDSSASHRLTEIKRRWGNKTASGEEKMTQDRLPAALRILQWVLDQRL
jgi:hypothetical protein